MCVDVLCGNLVHRGTVIRAVGEDVGVDRHVGAVKRGAQGTMHLVQEIVNAAVFSAVQDVPAPIWAAAGREIASRCMAVGWPAGGWQCTVQTLPHTRMTSRGAVTGSPSLW